MIIDQPDLARRVEALQSVRALGFSGPMIAIGELGLDETGEVVALPRPVRLGVLLARIDAHFDEPDESELFTLGAYDFLPAARILQHREGEASIRLTELEMKLLVALAQADGQTVARDALLAQVWGYNATVATHTVETHVWRLRQKIETDDPRTKFLVTEPGGYRIQLADATSEI